MSGQPGGAGDLHGSPQAVFTSFKLPKPGGGGSVGGGGGGLGAPIGVGGEQPALTSPGPISPVTNTTQSGFGSRLFPIGLGSLPTTPNSNALQSSPPKVNAPLGGLPALADQILMQQAGQMKNIDDLEAESNNNRLLSPSRSPLPASPPPSKLRSGIEGGDSSGSEGTPLKSQQGLIKAKGTYYPLTAFPTSMPQGPVMRCESPPHVEPTSSGEFLKNLFAIRHIPILSVLTFVTFVGG